MVLRKVQEHGLLCDKQLEFRSRCSTSLQVTRLVERVNRNTEERRVSGVVFLDVF
jgi:hypothetical protein